MFARDFLVQDEKARVLLTSIAQRIREMGKLKENVAP
jgi:hypothetical protein